MEKELQRLKEAMSWDPDIIPGISAQLQSAHFGQLTRVPVPKAKDVATPGQEDHIPRKSNQSFGSRPESRRLVRLHDISLQSLRSSSTEFVENCCILDTTKNMVSKSCIQQERNIFCEPFSVLVLLERDAKEAYCPERIIHTDSPDWLAYCNGGRVNRDIEFSRLSGLAGASLPGSAATTDASRRNTVKTSVMAAGSMDYLNDIILRGHSGSLQTIWFLSTQRLLLSAGFDIGIRLWDLSPDFSSSRSRYIRIFSGHQDSVLCLWVDQTSCEVLTCPTDPTSAAQKANETVLAFASGSADCTCKIWKTDCKDASMTLEHASPVTAVCLSGGICATGQLTGQLTIWQLLWRSGMGQIMKTLPAHSARINAVRFDELFVATASSDGYTRIWGFAKGVNRYLANFGHPNRQSSLKETHSIGVQTYIYSESDFESDAEEDASGSDEIPPAKEDGHLFPLNVGNVLKNYSQLLDYSKAVNFASVGEVTKPILPWRPQSVSGLYETPPHKEIRRAGIPAPKGPSVEKKEVSKKTKPQPDEQPSLTFLAQTTRSANMLVSVATEIHRKRARQSQGKKEIQALKKFDPSLSSDLSHPVWKIFSEDCSLFPL
ncbi:F-box/WD repeat-containing protein 10 [Sparganum proliferum]